MSSAPIGYGGRLVDGTEAIAAALQGIGDVYDR